MRRPVIIAARRAFDRSAAASIARGHIPSAEVIDAGGVDDMRRALKAKPHAIVIVDKDLEGALGSIAGGLGPRLIVLGEAGSIDWGLEANALPARLDAALIAVVVAAAIPAHDQPAIPSRPAIRFEPRCVLVASSTGGPTSLATLLKAMDPGPMPWIIAQHLPAGGGRSLAEHLAKTTGRNVFAAELGPVGGGVHLLDASSDFALSCAPGGVLRLRAATSDSPFHPNADMLFRSAHEAGIACVVIILSGMGRDGAEGAASLACIGSSIYVQEPTTCIVPGMPVATLETCPSARVFDPANPPQSLMRLCGRSR